MTLRTADIGLASWTGTETELRSQIELLVRTYARRFLSEAPFSPGVSAVPPAGKLIGEQELVNMVEASLDGWLTTGRFNQAFEKKLAAYLGIRHVMTVNSGSSANLIAFQTLTSSRLGDRAIRQGDEVITVAAGFPTTVNPILQFGAVPVFVDVNPDTLNIDTDQLAAAVSPRTRAVMLAHTLGNPFNLDAVLAFCQRHGLWLVEDCCDALGSTYSGRMVGTFGDIATVSFYPAHHITMGEGGAVFTRSDELRQIAESLRDWGRDCYCQPGRDNTCGRRFAQQHGTLPFGYDHKYTYSHLGYNLKITDMQAACGLAQLERVAEFVQARRIHHRWLVERLSSCAEFLTWQQPTIRSDPSWFGFALTLKPACPVTRLDLLSYLDQKKVGTRLLFSGNLVRQPSIVGHPFRVVGELKHTDRVMNQTFWVGVQPALSLAQLDHMATTIEGFLGLRF